MAQARARSDPHPRPRSSSPTLWSRSVGAVCSLLVVALYACTPELRNLPLHHAVSKMERQQPRVEGSQHIDRPSRDAGVQGPEGRDAAGGQAQQTVAKQPGHTRDVGRPGSSSGGGQGVTGNDMTEFMVHAATANATLLDYFYGGNGGYGTVGQIREHYHFRTANCNNGRPRGGPNYGGDIVYDKIQQGMPCLWDNMPSMKLVAVIALAQRMRVTHIIESGRMGGMSAYIYSLHGFSVTSVELLPVGSVERDLLAVDPSIRTLNGDGRELVPAALETIAQGASARVAVVLDGPKGRPAYELALRILRHTSISFVALDDSQDLVRLIDHTPGVLTFHTWSARYRRAFPMARDRQVARGVSTMVDYFKEDDCLSIMVPRGRGHTRL
mmetsp:Transcript_57675/g.159524  ORF Transcript_57675/g.159524 Transcript_57675/m.159524 type:complete len:384 (-) Transcript_57675:24-1175(-)